MFYLLRKFVPLLFSCLLVLSLSAQTEYYVSQAGAGDGTFESPFGTINEALAVAEPYDIITLRAGTYDPPSIIEQPHLTIRGYQGELPHITKPFGKDSPLNIIHVAYTAAYITLKNLEISGGICYVIKIDGDFGYEGASNIAAKGAIIEDCIIHHSGTDAIKITPLCDDITIKNCEIYHTGVAFESDENRKIAHEVPGGCLGSIDEKRNNQGIDNVNADRLLVQGCYIHDIPGDNPAIFFKGGARDCIVERNKFERAYSGVWIGGQTDWDHFTPDDNPNYYNNFNGIVRNNIIKDMRGEGIGFFSAHSPKVYNNTLIDCGTKQDESGTPALGIRTQAFVYKGTYYGPPTVNAFFANNVVIRKDIAKTEYHDFFIELSPEENLPPVATGTLQMKNNRYWDGLYGDLKVRNTDYNVPVDQWDTSTLIEWQASPLHNSSFADSQTIYADPKIDTDGKPIVGSNCIGTGIAIDGLTEDFYGNPRPAGAIDIGAVQFSSGGGNTEPTISITSPLGGSSFTIGQNITISVNAADTNGSITKVEFFQGSTKLGEDITSPYSYTWTDLSVGSYSLTAKVTDNTGESTTSSSVDITVNNADDIGYRYLRLKIVNNLGGSQVEYYDIDWFEGETNHNYDYFWGNADNLPFTLDLDLGVENGTNPTSIRFENGYNQTFQAKSFECYGSNNKTDWTLLHKETGLSVNDWGAESTYTTFVFNGQGNKTKFSNAVILGESTIYPNPGSELFNIEYVSEYKGDVTIDIFSLDGKTIESLKLQKVENQFSYKMKLSDQPTGTYIIRLRAGKYRSSHQIIKN